MAYISTLAFTLLLATAAPAVEGGAHASNTPQRVQVVARARIISADSVRKSSRLNQDRKALPLQVPDRIISRNDAGQIIIEFM